MKSNKLHTKLLDIEIVNNHIDYTSNEGPIVELRSLYQTIIKNDQEIISNIVNDITEDIHNINIYFLQSLFKEKDKSKIEIIKSSEYEEELSTVLWKFINEVKNKSIGSGTLILNIDDVVYDCNKIFSSNLYFSFLLINENLFVSFETIINKYKRYVYRNKSQKTKSISPSLFQYCFGITPISISKKSLLNKRRDLLYRVFKKTYIVTDEMLSTIYSSNHIQIINCLNSFFIATDSNFNNVPEKMITPIGTFKSSKKSYWLDVIDDSETSIESCFLSLLGDDFNHLCSTHKSKYLSNTKISSLDWNNEEILNLFTFLMLK